MSEAQKLMAALFAPADLVEMRPIDNRRGLARAQFILAGEYPGSEPALHELNRAGWDIYFGVNPRAHDCGKESAVEKLVAFHADVDAHSYKLIDQPPSIVVASGHGYHLYWQAEPIPVTGDNLGMLKSINRGLALAVGGDASCCDLSRILRLPDFMNHKRGDGLIVKLLEVHPERRYTLDEMRRFARPLEGVTSFPKTTRGGLTLTVRRPSAPNR